jgi:hypothetical protein
VTAGMAKGQGRNVSKIRIAGWKSLVGQLPLQVRREALSERS